MHDHDEEGVQALKLMLIREYDSIVPAVALLAGASRAQAQEALHTAICRALVGVTRRPPGNPVVAWRSYIIRTAMNVLKDEARDEARRRENENVLLFSEFSELSPGFRRLGRPPRAQPPPLGIYPQNFKRAKLWRISNWSRS